MKNKALVFDTAKTVLLLVPALLTVSIAAPVAWWIGIIPAFLTGAVAGVRKWRVNGFAAGFWTGALLWMLADVYFDELYKGAALRKIGLLLSMNMPMVMLAAALIGGLLTGLSVYTGKGFFSQGNSKK